MRKISFALAVVVTISLVIGLALAGCAPAAEPTPTSAPPAPTQPSAAPTQPPAAPTQAPAAQQPAAAAKLSLVTGGTAGTYYPLGGAMANIWTQAGVASVTAESSGASVENIRLLGNKKADLALVQNDVADFALNGIELFKDGAIEVGGIAILYPEVIQIVASADSGIKSLTDLKGKRVGVGAAGSGTEADFRLMLDAIGMTYKDLGAAQYLSFAESAQAFKDRKIDAAVVVAGVPNPAIQDITTLQDIVIVPVAGDEADTIKNKYGFFAKTTIPANTYKGQAEAVDTVAVLATLVCRTDLDTELVYNLTKTLFEKQAELGQAHAKGKELSKENALDGLTVPLHSGAEKYFKEVGVLK